jgi:lipopolysaccharide biosynthesis glycosyltransferase
MKEYDIEPAFDENNIPIVLTSSQYYTPYMAVTLYSIIQNASIQNNYDFIILHKEIKREDRQTVMGMAEDYANVSIRFVEVDHNTDENDFNFREGYSSESFYRVIMIRILKKYTTVLYFDCDVVAVRDVADLYNGYDVSDYCVAAARDIDGQASSICGHDDRKSYMLGYMGLRRLTDYFQSGVMIFNLERIRKTYSVDEIIQRSCAKEIMFGDQDVLNILYKNQVLYLDMKWNVIMNPYRTYLQRLFCLASKEILNEYLEARKEPYIIHYAGSDKPWMVPDTDMAEAFWRVVRGTPFYEEIVSRMLAGAEDEQ